MRRTGTWPGIVAVTAIALAGLVSGTPSAVAVPTDMAISTTAIDFGAVAIGSTAQASVTLTNTGGDPFGPINIFGGAPPTAEFNASQNCQGTTLAAGGSCKVNYSFSPGAAGAFNDTSAFTISETQSQGDGEDFTVTLQGTGPGGAPTTTTTTPATTTTSTTRPTATTRPTGTTRPRPGGQATPGGATATTAPPAGQPLATLAEATVDLGREQRATVRGFQPSEVVSAVMQPGDVDLGSRVADAQGVVRFTWAITDDQDPGSYEFVATGAQSGDATATFAVAEDDGGSGGISPLLIAALVGIALLIAAGVGYLVTRRGRHPAP